MRLERLSDFNTQIRETDYLAKTYSTTKELFGDILESAKKGEKRNALADLKAYLRLRNINYSVEFVEKAQSNIPVILAPNHYTRPLIERKGFSTTGESFLTTAVASVASEKVLGEKKIIWSVKRLTEKVKGISKLDRQVQNATRLCYDYLFVDKNFFRESIKVLQCGNALGFFPEQRPTTKMGEYHKSFRILLSALQIKNVDYQIAPVSIYTEGGSYIANFGEIIKPSRNDKPDEIANLTMRLIAKGLPRKLQGEYL